MSLQMEHVLPDGFVYEKAQNIIHGTYRGIRLLILTHPSSPTLPHPSQ